MMMDATPDAAIMLTATTGAVMFVTEKLICSS